ncbi:MAG: MogA/MoaB family molybdenum cofactor biosynthesis protein [Acidobacteriota bacterium]|nr:MogA/MoaB family molybdenum cofactor biosynthesis protein [Acidobacteriota bacterium]
MNIPVAVITISDSVAGGTRPDHSGPAVRHKLEESGYLIQSHEIVPDERKGIADLLRSLCDGGRVRAVFTTGGTGIAPRDVTPEATRDVIEREIPGLGEVMRAEGRKVVNTAPLSRALAGSRGSVLVVNLPGSPRGAVESLDAIVELLPHIVDLLNGNTEHS